MYHVDTHTVFSLGAYSLSDGGRWSKMKVSFSVSSQSILKGLSRNFEIIIISSFGNNPKKNSQNSIEYFKS